jgi:ABC-type transporter Mla subunit MlaD
MQHKTRFLPAILTVLLLLWGCMQSSLTLQVRYPDVLGLKVQDPVYFQQNEIGKVLKISYTQQGDFLVELNIVADFKNAATADSKFFIENNPKVPQGKAVVIVQEKPGGKALEGGAIVQGSVRPGLLDDMLSGLKRTAVAAQFGMQEAMQQMDKSLKETSQKLDQEMAAALDDLSRRLQTFSEEVKKAPDREEVKQLERSIKQLADEFSRAQQNVRDHIRDQLIPQLHKELDQLREQLHKEGRDGEIEEIDKQVKVMSRV